MDVELLKNEDSDVEVLDNEQLRTAFSKQQLRLIAALSKCKSRIPKDWTTFKKFVESCAVGTVPNEQVIRSIWTKLDAVENSDQSSTSNHVIEISDDDNPSEANLDRSFNVPKKKRKRRSMPAAMNEEEAERLREQLLMDRLLELELSKVLKEITETSKKGRPRTTGGTSQKRRSVRVQKMALDKNNTQDISIVHNQLKPEE